MQAACSEEQWQGGGGALSDAADGLVNNPKKLVNLLVDDRNRVLYCYVPKVKDATDDDDVGLISLISST